MGRFPLVVVSEENNGPKLQGRILRQVRNQQKQATSLLFDRKDWGAICSSETSVSLRTIRRYNSKNRNLHSHFRENLNFALHNHLYMLPTTVITAISKSQQHFYLWYGSSPKHPDWIWGPPSLLSNGYWGYSLTGIKRPGRQATTRLNLVSRLIMRGTITQPPHTYIWHSV
jgi:hypothetical protein